MSRSKTFTGGLAAAALVGFLHAPARLSAREPAAPVREAYRLANGLRVVLAPDTLSPGVAVAVRYAAGQAHDPRDYRGLAHLVEHLTFRGSRHLGPLEGPSVLEEQGAGYNGMTSLDATTYISAGRATSLETILWIESERMGFALDGIDEQALEVEKEVVARELAEREHNLSHAVWSAGQRVLYGRGHPFAPPENEAADVRVVDLSAVRWFWQSSHRPDNALLVIAGSFERAKARAAVERYFATLQNPKLPALRVDVAPPKLCGRHRLELSHPYTRGNSLSFIWPVPGGLAPLHHHDLEAVSELLRQRLRRELVERLFKAAALHASVWHSQSHGYLHLEVALHDDLDWDKVEATILSEAQRLAREPLADVELRSLRALLTSRYLFGRDDTVARALAASQGFDPERERELIDTLDAARLQAAAKLLSGSHLMIRAEAAPASGGELTIHREVNPCR